MSDNRKDNGKDNGRAGGDGNVDLGTIPPGTFVDYLGLSLDEVSGDGCDRRRRDMHVRCELFRGDADVLGDVEQGAQRPGR